MTFSHRITDSFKVGTVYKVSSTFSTFGGPVSISCPSLIQRGKPPSNTEELTCENAYELVINHVSKGGSRLARNINRALGEEKTPWVSYLRNLNCVIDNFVRPYNMTCVLCFMPISSFNIISADRREKLDRALPHALANVSGEGIMCFNPNEAPSSVRVATSSISKNRALGSLRLSNSSFGRRGMLGINHVASMNKRDSGGTEFAWKGLIKRGAGRCVDVDMKR